MGFTSFFVCYKSEQEKANIILSIITHNQLFHKEDVTVGGFIEYVIDNKQDRCLLFANGCGSSRTYEYFENLGYGINFYEDFESVYGYPHNIQGQYNTVVK